MKQIWLLLAFSAVMACSGSRVEPGPNPTLSGEAALIIAHRGASGELPEHTIEAYTLALQQGADFIEPDLVMTKDAVLIARHDRYLSTTTNVAEKPEFADRKRTSDGREDWWAEDFTLAEIKTLKARQPFEGRSKDYDDLYEIPTFAEVVNLAIASGIGLYPETKSPSYHASIGLDMKAPLLEAMDGLQVPVFIQSFEAGILRDLDPTTQFKLVQLVSGDPRARIAGHEPPLEDVATYADGVGPNKALLWQADGVPTDFVRRAHRLGLVVHPWTYRNDRVDPRFQSIEQELAGTLAQGVDGVFTDFTDTGMVARQLFLDDQG